MRVIILIDKWKSKMFSDREREAVAIPKHVILQNSKFPYTLKPPPTAPPFLQSSPLRLIKQLPIM
jgi:hypothetical protein